MPVDALPPSPWIRTSDRLPQKEEGSRSDHTWCLVYYRNDVRILAYNHHYQVWDDESADDYECDPLGVSHWMLLPAPPEKDPA